MAVQPIPDNRSRITPYLVVSDADKLLNFLKQVFDAEEFSCMKSSDGTVMHAEVRIGGESIMMGEAHGEWPPMPGSVYIYVEDSDATYKRALDAGATSIMEPADQFHGDRYGGVTDPVGNQWWIVSHVEDVSPEDLARREKEFIEQMQQQ